MYPNRNLRIKKLSYSKQMTDNYGNNQPGSSFWSSYRRWPYPVHSFSGRESCSLHQKLAWKLKSRLSPPLLEAGTTRRYSFPAITCSHLLNSLFACILSSPRRSFLNSEWFNTFCKTPDYLWNSVNVYTYVNIWERVRQTDFSQRPCLHRDMQQNYSAFNF